MVTLTSTCLLRSDGYRGQRKIWTVRRLIVDDVGDASQSSSSFSFGINEGMHVGGFWKREGERFAGPERGASAEEGLIPVDFGKVLRDSGVF